MLGHTVSICQKSDSPDKERLDYLQKLNLKPGDLLCNSNVYVDLGRIFDKKDPARFSNLLLFSFAMIMSSIGWLTYAPIIQNLGDFGLYNFHWNYLFVVYLLAFIPFNFVSIWTIE